MKHKKTIIISVIVLAISFILIALFNSTYALFSSDDYAKLPESYSTGLLQITANSISDNISLDNALPITDEDGMLTEAYVFTIKNVGNLNYKFDIKLLSSGNRETSFSPQYIKIQVDDGSAMKLSDLVNGIIKEDITLNVGESIDVSVRIWLSIETPNTELGKSFNCKIITDGQAVYTETNYDAETETFVDYITTLYLNNKDKVVTNNNIEYQYSTSVGLMNDRLGGTTEDYDAGNIRYYGGKPNNYIDIGDRTNDGKVILYRVIGLFNDIELEDGTTKDLIKVIRDEPIGKYAWDNKTNGIGSSLSNEASNDWTDSRLMMLLNPGYNLYNTSNPLLDSSGNTIYGYEGSLWWNSKSGTCYSGSSNGTTSCDFTSSGLSSDIQDKIEIIKWNIGGCSSCQQYSNYMYNCERGTDTYSGFSSEWIGKIALMYPSDFGYSGDFQYCIKTLWNYNGNGCPSYNWLVRNDSRQWLLTHRTNNSNQVFYALSGGDMGNNSALYSAYSIRPTFYLRDNLSLMYGTGSVDDPYVLTD